MALKRRSKFLGANGTVLSQKIKESFSSVLPVAALILVLCITVTPLDSGTFLAFLFGCALVIVGMGVFTLGADTAMTPIGQYISSSVVKTKKLWLIMPIYFLVGVFITVSEPDLQVLARELGDTVDYAVLLITVGVGVGVFLIIALLKILLNVGLKYILIVSYAAVFVMAFFVPSNFVPLAFDSGGVTTGPMSVPFIIAMGTGIVYLRSDAADDDGFGLTALCSIGPIIAVMILGLIYRPESISAAGGEPLEINDSKQLFWAYLEKTPVYMKEVGLALLPIVAFYFSVMIFGGKSSKSKLVKVLIGLLYVYFGLVAFLIGVNCGFLPVGTVIGKTFGGGDFAWAAIPIGILFGFFTVGAEPAVHVLTEQVYEITVGAIPKAAMRLSLMCGVGVSVGLAFLKIYFSVPVLYFLIPGYFIALTLAFFVPKTFTAIAFDSGGVASGAMTAGFLMPMALGFCQAIGGDVGADGFGLVALVAMTPLIAIQILGLIFKFKNAVLKKTHSTERLSEEIIE